MNTKRLLKILAVAMIMLAFTACNKTVDGLEYKLYEDGDTSYYTVFSYTEDTSVTEVTIPDEIDDIPVTGIEKSAFAYTSSLEVLNIGKNITYIDDWGISFNLYLKEINVDADNETYASVDGVLYSKDLTILEVYPNAKVAEYDETGTLLSSETVYVMDGVVEISKCAFYKCWAISEIVFPDTVEILGERSFLKCTNLVSIDVGDGLRIVEEDVFLGCDNADFNSITFPATLEYISYGAFYAAKYMMEINIGASEDQVTLEDEWYPSSGGTEVDGYVVTFDYVG